MMPSGVKAAGDPPLVPSVVNPTLPHLDAAQGADGAQLRHAPHLPHLHPLPLKKVDDAAAGARGTACQQGAIGGAHGGAASWCLHHGCHPARAASSGLHHGRTASSLLRAGRTRACSGNAGRARAACAPRAGGAAHCQHLQAAQPQLLSLHVIDQPQPDSGHSLEGASRAQLGTET